MEITCKIDVDFQTITFNQVQKLKLVFVNCWGQLLPHQVLNLKHVQEGCTELVFRVPAYFRHVYSQLSPEQMQHLKENAFIEVKIGQQVILKVITIFTRLVHTEVVHKYLVLHSNTASCTSKQCIRILARKLYRQKVIQQRSC